MTLFVKFEKKEVIVEQLIFLMWHLEQVNSILTVIINMSLEDL